MADLIAAGGATFELVITSSDPAVAAAAAAAAAIPQSTLPAGGSREGSGVHPASPSGGVRDSKSPLPSSSAPSAVLLRQASLKQEGVQLIPSPGGTRGMWPLGGVSASLVAPPLTGARSPGNSWEGYRLACAAERSAALGAMPETGRSGSGNSSGSNSGTHPGIGPHRNVSMIVPRSTASRSDSFTFAELHRRSSVAVPFSSGPGLNAYGSGGGGADALLRRSSTTPVPRAADRWRTADSPALPTTIMRRGSCPSSSAPHLEREVLGGESLESRLHAAQAAATLPLPSPPTNAANGSLRCPAKDDVCEPASGVFDVTVAPGQSLQAALSRCPPGGTVLLLPGMHAGPLVLADKTMHVFGRGQATLVARTVDVVSSTVLKSTLDGIAIRQEGEGSAGRFAISVTAGRLRVQDCDVTSRSGLGCISVDGVGADPTFVGCRVHDSARVGVAFEGGCRGSMRDCDVWGNEKAGIWIGDGAYPSISCCKVHDGRDVGVGISGVHTTGRLESCEVWANREAGIWIVQGADPVVSDNRVRDGLDVGISIGDEGTKGHVEGNVVTGNVGAGIWVQNRAEPTLTDNIIHDGHAAGVVFCGAGTKGRLEGSSVYGNAGPNVHIISGADPVVVVNKIFGGRRSSGVVVQGPGSKGLLEGNELWDNAEAGVLVQSGADPTLNGNTVRDHGEGYAVVVRPSAQATIGPGNVWLNNGKGDVIRL